MQVIPRKFFDILVFDRQIGWCSSVRYNMLHLADPSVNKIVEIRYLLINV